MKLLARLPQQLAGVRALATALLLGLIADCHAAGLDGTVMSCLDSGFLGKAGSWYVEDSVFLSPDGKTYALFHKSWGAVSVPELDYQPRYVGNWSFTPSSATPNAGTLTLPFRSGGFTNASITLNAPAEQASSALIAGSASKVTIYRASARAGNQNFSSRQSMAPRATGVMGLIVDKETCWYLIRATGKSLASYGVKQPISATSLWLNGDRGELVATGRKWNETADSAALMAQLFAMSGAFPLDADGNEVVLLWRLKPGIYTIGFANPTQAEGECMIEVYALHHDQ